MKLVFTCPETEETFYSDAYAIVENRGVICDSRGNKVLDAMVKLGRPCPACGKRHIYAAAELACPLSPSEKSKRSDHGR
jgi:predicted RNA-binding Zn-ribbon protein involved in translation (DUF1610 family)